jgi:two pore calcium channel protein
MYDSLVMVIFIVFFIFAFSWMGQRLYMGTVEGAMHFKTLENSLWSMLVCLTTSNFPDVMLPGYMAYRPYCILFLIFMVMGLFLFMSLVLAIFYSNFKLRYENKIAKDMIKRNEFLLNKFE